MQTSQRKRRSDRYFKLAGTGLLLATLFLTGSCGKKERNNLLDPGSDGYVAPAAIPTVDLSGTTLKTDSLNLSWTGNNTECEFGTLLDNGAWSPWTQTTSYSSLLDDGSHTLIVRTRYRNGSEITLDTINFTVAALPAIAAYTVPRLALVTGDTATIRLYIKGIPSASVAHFKFRGVSLLSTGSSAINTPAASILINDSLCDVYALGASASCIDPQGAVAVLKVKFDPARDTTFMNLISCELKTAIMDTTISPKTIQYVRGSTLIRNK